jgi:hypothetical protein
MNSLQTDAVMSKGKQTKRVQKSTLHPHEIVGDFSAGKGHHFSDRTQKWNRCQNLASKPDERIEDKLPVPWLSFLFHDSFLSFIPCPTFPYWHSVD